MDSDSDVAFVAKMVIASFVLGGVIKYGSLLVDFPFQPNAAAALLFVLAPPAIWAVRALTRQ